ncbi:MAG: HD family phosphohydrolase [Ammonifex sp.]|nr:MAG: HD family phosphohydrolase [Ammonifex sp.]
MKDLKDELFEYLRRVQREGIEHLVFYLAVGDYFTAPSSTQYHGACEAGNLRHSLNVTGLMFRLRNAFGLDKDDIPDDSLIICGLFHDLGKSMYYSKPHYIQNRVKSGKVSDSKPYCCNPERLPIPHQVASVHILSQYIYLTEEETYAILYHNGLYTPDGRVIQGRETPLQMILHWADMWASRVIEARKPENGKGAACNAD